MKLRGDFMLHSKSPLILQFAQNGDGKEVLDDAIKGVPKRIPESEPGDALNGLHKVDQ